MTNESRATIRTVHLLALTLAIAACSPGPEPEREVPPAERPLPTAQTSTAGPELQPVPMAYEEPTVGGAVMVVGDDIMRNLARSKDHTILVAAIKQAGLDEVLSDPGPLTLFAPTNSAFDRVPGGLDALLAPDARERLVRLLSYHIVPEKLDDMALANRVMSGNGSASLRTVEGGYLKATVGDGSAVILDAQGGAARITVPNVLQRNGVVQVVDKVLFP